MAKVYIVLAANFEEGDFSILGVYTSLGSAQVRFAQEKASADPDLERIMDDTPTYWALEDSDIDECVGYALSIEEHDLVTLKETNDGSDH